MRKNKKHTKEFKIQVAKEYLKGGISENNLAKKYGINKTQVHEWAKIYKEQGESGFERKVSSGRPKDFKNMTKDEQIEYLLMENEILKKAYALTQEN